MKRILITRPRNQTESFAQALLTAGMQPVFFPVIEIAPLKDMSELDNALRQLDSYDWLILTSVNGVEAVWERLQSLGISQLPAALRVAAIGPKTAASLNEQGVTPDFIPDEYVAEAILPGLGDLKGKRALLPRADIARKALAEGIEKAGGTAHEVAAYHTVSAQPDPEGITALRQGVDVVTLTSSSTVRNFVSVVTTAGLDPVQLPGNPLFACIGPVTASTAHEEGLPVDIVAEEYTTEGLIKALEALRTS